MASTEEFHFRCLAPLAMLVFLTPLPALAVWIPETGAWYDLTPAEEIDEYLDQKSVMELCNSWKKQARKAGRTGDKARVHIGDALERRGENPFLCQMMGFGS